MYELAFYVCGTDGVCAVCVCVGCGILVCAVCGVLVERVMCVVCVYGGCWGRGRWCVFMCGVFGGVMWVAWVLYVCVVWCMYACARVVCGCDSACG